MKRAGLLVTIGVLAVACVGQSCANAAWPVAAAAKSAKKCKKKHHGKKKHKKCKKKKGSKQPTAPAPPASGSGPLSISPPGWDFGGFPIGLSTGSQQFTVSNTSAGVTGPLSTRITGPNAPNFQIAPDDG